MNRKFNCFNLYPFGVGLHLEAGRMLLHHKLSAPFPGCADVVVPLHV